MKLNTAFIALLLVFAVQSGSAQVAVIPYRIVNSSTDFPVSLGKEYSRLLSVAASISKENVEIASPRDIDIDLERMKLSPQEAITRADLDLLGRTRHIDYFLTGNLARTGKGYRSESVLYSVRDRKIVARVRVGDEDLFRLAEQEVKEAFVQYRNRDLTAAGSVPNMDVVFLLDLSYRINNDWASVKEAIVECSADCIDSLRIDTRVYIIPFSDRTAYPAASVSINSIAAVRTELDKLNPAGGPGADNFIKSLRYAVQNVRWRPAARKIIILIADSSPGSRFDEKYAVLARNKGISIVSISLGQVAGDHAEVFDRLSSITGGVHYHAAYHQKLYDAEGRSVELYFENGRLFKSPYIDAQWQKGLYIAGRKAQAYGKPKSFLEEIHYNDKKISVSPRTMAEAYGRITVERMINQEKLENNIDLILKSSVSTGHHRQERSGIAGKALISDGTISLWIYARDGRAMTFLENSRKAGYYVLLGVVVERDSSATYGVTLVPAVTDLEPGSIPELMKARLSDIIRQSDYYMTRGLFHPPVWFVSVKVDNVEGSSIKKDIRER